MPAGRFGSYVDNISTASRTFVDNAATKIKTAPTTAMKHLEKAPQTFQNGMNAFKPKNLKNTANSVSEKFNTGLKNLKMDEMDKLVMKNKIKNNWRTAKSNMDKAATKLLGERLRYKLKVTKRNIKRNWRQTMYKIHDMTGGKVGTSRKQTQKDFDALIENDYVANHARSAPDLFTAMQPDNPRGSTLSFNTVSDGACRVVVCP